MFPMYLKPRRLHEITGNAQRDWGAPDNGTGKSTTAPAQSKGGLTAIFSQSGGVPQPAPIRFQAHLPGAGKPEK